MLEFCFMKRLENQVAIVTGGTRGIGKSVAKLLAREGATTIITGRSDSSSAADEINTQLKAELNGNGDAAGQVQYCQCDVSSKESVDSLIKKVLEEHKQINILVNNAGITKDNLYMRMKEDEWFDVMNTNLNSLFYICQPVVKAMSKQRSGSIINMGSVVGIHGNPGQVNYTTSKAGMIGFTKSVAKEYGRRGIRVNCIAPGFIVTEMTGELPEDVQSKYKENIPLGDFGGVEDIGELAIFLASKESKYITGQVIQVDGGLFM